MFEYIMLKRFRNLSSEELWKRIDLLEREGKIGYFNGYLHSNWPENFYERVSREHKNFEVGKEIVTCSRCGKTVIGKWNHVFNILKANNSLIANPFKEEGYAYRYWIYPEKYEDRIFRKKLGEAKG